MASPANAPPLDEALLGSIYEGPLEPLPWQGLVSLLRQHISMVACSLHLQLPSPEQQGLDVTDADWDVHALRQHYESGYYAHNPFSYDDMQAGTVYRWTDFVSRERFIRSDYYRDFFQPAGFDHALCLGIDEPGGRKMWLSLVRNVQQGDFTASEEELLSRLYEHLRRALKLHAKIQLNETEKVAYQSATEYLALGTVILDQQANIISANDAAQLIAKNNKMMSFKNATIQLSEKNKQQALKTLIQTLLHTAAPGQTEALSLATFAEPAPGLLLRRFPDQRQANMPAQAALIVYITDPNHHQLAPQQLVSQLFGLTPTEAKLATLLADGLSLTEAATEMNVSEGSARSYCKRIYAKTGLKRQAEVVRLVLKSVASLAGS